VYHRQKTEGYNANNETSNKKHNASVSDVNIKNGKGKTGVDLRWHKFNEYKLLNREQKDELSSWQRSAEFKKATETYKANRQSSKRFSTSDGNVDTNGKKFCKALAAAVKIDRDKDARLKKQCTDLATENASALSVPPASANSVGSLAVRKTNEDVNAKVASILKSSGVRFDKNE